MIAITKSQNPKNIPATLTKQECINSLEKIINLNDPKHKEKIESKIYRAEDVYNKLKSLYHNKCAYCESFEDQPEIEHYRPKGRVSGDSSHGGYYWLAYEWTNLLPACHDCNRQGAKGNFFPIVGTRKYIFDKQVNGNIKLSSNNLMSPYLQEEKPLLLNPEVYGFNPFDYFKFDTTGKIEEAPSKNTFNFQQAEATIKIIELNRDKIYLNYRKIKIRKLFLDKFQKTLLRFCKNEISYDVFKIIIFTELNEIKENAKPHKEFSFFWDYLYKNFQFFIINYFNGRKQIPFLKLYKEHVDQ